MANFPFPKPNIPEGLEARLPFILRQFMDPCDAPWTVWVNAMWPALIDALIVWYEVDMVQIFRTMWKPPLYGLRRRALPHGTRDGHGGKKGLKRTFQDIISFDPNDWVGKGINPYAEYEMVELLPGEIWFWSGIELVVIAAFYWSVIEVLTGFLYEWTSGVSESKYCRARDDGVLLAGAPGYPLLGIFGWDPIGVLDPYKMRNITSFTGFSVAQELGVGVVSCNFGYENVGGEADAWIDVRMRCLNGPRTGAYAERRIGSGPFTTGTGGASYDMNRFEAWIGEIRVNGSWKIIEPRLFCHARGTA